MVVDRLFVTNSTHLLTNIWVRIWLLQGVVLREILSLLDLLLEAGLITVPITWVVPPSHGMSWSRWLYRTNVFASKCYFLRMTVNRWNSRNDPTFGCPTIGHSFLCHMSIPFYTDNGNQGTKITFGTTFSPFTLITCFVVLINPTKIGILILPLSLSYRQEAILLWISGLFVLETLPWLKPAVKHLCIRVLVSSWPSYHIALQVQF